MTTFSCQTEDVDPIDVEEISALPEEIDSPADNQFSMAKFELGRSLFWDPILSGNEDVACATCHHPALGYGDGLDLSLGVFGTGLGTNRSDGELAKRNAPTIVNTAFNGINQDGEYDPVSAPMFWDNRANGLEEQALEPILSAEEMRGTDIAEDDILDIVVSRINAVPAYRSLFEEAFGDETVNSTNLAKALATFQRNIVANNSPFDRYMRGDLDAMSDDALEGMQEFISVGCVNCHNGPMFSDYEPHTLSVPDHPSVFDDGTTGDFDFRTPTLRNLDFSAPYMHNGAFESLREVLEFYNDISRGNGDSENPNVADNEIDEDARDLDLDRGDINEILTFLNSLNDSDFDKTVPSSVPSGLPVGGNIQ